MKILGYDVEKKKVKNINLRIRNDGTIYISAPINIDNSFIENFILSKKEWIDKHIKRIENYKKITENINIYTNNSFIMFLGKLYKLILKEDNNFSMNILNNNITICNNNLDPETIKNIIYNKLYYVNAKIIFQKRLNYFLEITNEKKDIKLKISHIKSKWGTCIPKLREINLSIELLKKSEVEIDSVIIHEVAHLKYPNHSKDFYNYINIYFKNYKEINKKLNSHI